jgi:GT2 family glycosyltransferase
VIIPAHNAAAFLPETLRSVEAQTFADWEIAAVDDGSSDETWSILQAAGPWVRAQRNEAAQGPAAARNRALAEASGELVAFLDADDLFLPNYLERQIACFEEATRAGRRVGLVACDALLLDDGIYAEKTYLDSVRGRGRPLTLEVVLRRNPVYAGSLVPAAVGRSVGWFDEELFGTEDFGLWVKILERGWEAIPNPEPLAVYRRHHGTVSSNLARQGANTRRVYELASARGALTARQRRIARQAIRHNNAIEAVAKLRFGPRDDLSVLGVLRLVPMLIWVIVTSPGLWGQWLTILVKGRVPAVSRRRSAHAQRARSSR